MNKSLGLMFSALALAALAGCNQTNPLNGVWKSKNGGNPLTFKFHSNGTMSVDMVNNMSIPPSLTTVNGHYRVMDTNHLILEIKDSYKTTTLTQGYALSGGELILQAYGENALGLTDSTNVTVRRFRKE